MFFSQNFLGNTSSQHGHSSKKSANNHTQNYSNNYQTIQMNQINGIGNVQVINQINNYYNNQYSIPSNSVSPMIYQNSTFLRKFFKTKLNRP